jgi:lipopolysaccharide export system protein LptC
MIVCAPVWSDGVAVDRHTRMVGWLKVALPLLAVAVLATLFLLSDQIDPEDALPYAEVDVVDRAREPRMTAPNYAGTTSDGASLTLTADEARPAAADTPAKAQELVLELKTPDGGRTELRAAAAEIDRGTQQMVFSGGVTVTTDTGYRMDTDEVLVRMDRSRLESRSAVTATGPVGDLEAGGMVLTQDSRTPGAYVLVFNQGVRLVYRPGG